ncbi:MAG: tetratricopeptide repeat protein [Gammaproteobacteria bacterium]|nr:tetratricopeptide repeat protein [Gammaproteobacteria bacterium]
MRRLTGGNPRLLVLACRMLIESPLGSAFEDLEQLIDEQTPYFKARIEELPIQARKVFDCLANGWRPMLAKEVAGAAKLSSSHASAQLKQLVERGYAQEVRLPGAKRTRYEVGDRFYNIYYVLRFSRTNRRRLERLVAFLHDLFGASGMRPMYPTFLEALRLGGPRTGDSSDWLEIMARYVAADPDYQGREDWRRGALDLAKELIGPNAPVAERIENAFVAQHPPELPLLGELLQRGDDHFQANQFTEAEEVFREALAIRPNNVRARWMLGMSLFLGGKNEDAVVALEHCMEQVDSGGSPASRTWIVLGLAGRSIACSRLGRLEGAAEGLEQFSEYVDPEASAELRVLAASTYGFYGFGLADAGRLEEAIAALRRVTEYVRPDDPRETRHVAAPALMTKGNILSELEHQEEAIGAWGQVTEYVRTKDPVGLREIAVYALANKIRAIFPVEVDGDTTPNSYEGANTAVELMAEYVQPDDPKKLRDFVARLLWRMGMLLNLFGDFGRAEAACRKAADINLSDAEPWRVLAEAILRQGDDARLSEAEDYARRAVDLAPENPIASRTLSEILTRLGKWTEALDWLERSLMSFGEESRQSVIPGLTEPLIRAVAAGHGKRVKEMMEEANLSESMEPLWHAVRAELGEELEPLPAEIMDAVTEIRSRFSKE